MIGKVKIVKALNALEDIQSELRTIKLTTPEKEVLHDYIDNILKEVVKTENYLFRLGNAIQECLER